MKKLIFNAFIAGKIAKLFAGIKGYKTQIGVACIVVLQLAKYFAPIPPDYLSIIDEIIKIIIGATGVSLGDKIRRNWEIAKSAVDDLVDKAEPVK